ncbi:NUAK SNF1-like kinase 2 [Mortierella antarctica]|nr:NUAK SNF1-like kinase 2 [Mortierella antarctica]
MLKDAALKIPAHASERRRSKAESTAAHVSPGFAVANAVVLDAISTADGSTHNPGSNANDHAMQYRQPHNVSQGSSASTRGHHSGSHTAPTPQQFHNVKAPIPSAASGEGSSDPTASASTTHQPASGRQSRLSNVGSSKESYRRKYGEIQGYTYIGTIGQGNFGKVLLAENDLTGEKVAVKILEKASFKSEQQRLHATREARLMATLRHPNIVDVKTVMEDDYRILIVMENLTGGELFDYISNKGSLDEREARRIFQQIVLAIHYCHENNVVHRDLKPENILLDSDRNVRVADFGFGNNWHKDRHLTTYCGSPFYAAPEMVSGTPYIGPETDVWSLGVILYVLVEGSIDVCSLIHRMLTVDPKRRATLADVLRSRWMRAEGMDSMVAALPALSTAPATIRPAPGVRTQQQQQPHASQHQARSTGLATFHPNVDISTTMAAPTVNTHPRPHRPEHQNNRHSYHPPGTNDTQQHEPVASYRQPQRLQQQHPQQPIQPSYNIPRDLDLDDQMSDVSPSMANSPTETMATISPSTPMAPTSKDEALLAAAAGVASSYQQQQHHQKRSNTLTSNTYDDKHPHHPYKHPNHHHHSRTSSVHANAFGPGQPMQQPDNVVLINMCPSSDAIMDGLDSSLKKKRKALTKLRQFFRFESASTKC